jgi:DNA-binding CsgD family transcriptional regulator
MADDVLGRLLALEVERLQKEVERGSPAIAAIARDMQGKPGLSSRERTVVALVAHDLDLRQIAELTGRSRHTIEYQAKAARRKLGCRTLAGAVAMAFRLGIID